MHKINLYFIIIIICLVSLVFTFIILKTVFSPAIRKESIPQSLLAFKKAYPSHIISVKKNALVFKDETEMVYDDGIFDKDFDMLLNSPDLEDQFSIPYPAGRTYVIPIPVNHDPGRIRFEPFFKKIYGATPEEVKNKLTTIYWMPLTVNIPIKVTTVNSVHDKLKKISAECDLLPHHLKKYVTKLGGTYKWRNIQNTERLSMHSLGIAIDINTEYSDYWLKDDPGLDNLYKYKNSIPMEIVNIFEKYGFIWGGKWYHYDTMHFEYRPELFINRKE